jgi:hypothetical protein
LVLSGNVLDKITSSSSSKRGPSVSADRVAIVGSKIQSPVSSQSVSQ